MLSACETGCVSAAKSAAEIGETQADCAARIAR
jgi:hypothetical protein